MDASSLASGLCERVGDEGSKIGRRRTTATHAAGVRCPTTPSRPAGRRGLTGEQAGVIDSLDAINAVVPRRPRRRGVRLIRHHRRPGRDAIDRFGQLFAATRRTSRAYAPLSFRTCPMSRSSTPPFHQTTRHAFIYGLPGIMNGIGATASRHLPPLRRAARRNASASRASRTRTTGRHLPPGNGCSMTAVKAGRSIDNTLGFTPLGAC